MKKITILVIINNNGILNKDVRKSSGYLENKKFK